MARAENCGRLEDAGTSQNPLPTRAGACARGEEQWLAAKTFRLQAMRLKRLANSISWRERRHMEVTFVAALLRASERAVQPGLGRRRKARRGLWLVEDATDGTVVLELVVPSRRTVDDFRQPIGVTLLRPDRFDLGALQHWAARIVRGPVRPAHRAQAAEET